MEHLFFGIFYPIWGWLILGFMAYMIAFLKGLSGIPRGRRLTSSIAMLFLFSSLITTGPIGFWILSKLDFKNTAT